MQTDGRTECHTYVYMDSYTERLHNDVSITSLDCQTGCCELCARLTKHGRLDTVVGRQYKGLVRCLRSRRMGIAPRLDVARLSEVPPAGQAYRVTARSGNRIPARIGSVYLHNSSSVRFDRM